MSRRLFAAVALAGTLGLGACATQPGPYAYSPYEAGTIARVEEGVVISSRPVSFGGQQRGSGALVGGAAGATIGSQFGGDTDGRIFGAILGGIMGAVAGDAVQNNQTSYGFAYTIRRERDGSMIEVAQAEPQPLPNGAKVHITYGDRVRIVPAY